MKFFIIEISRSYDDECAEDELDDGAPNELDDLLHGKRPGGDGIGTIGDVSSFFETSSVFIIPNKLEFCVNPQEKISNKQKQLATTIFFFIT
ncbi:hypothetical protein FACS1894122_01190 [Alphaproteobacteria bacterium]|nr:hypothetical protein FACS1894122_01190 [Alphaproteobacteria bacterium]